VAARLSEAPSRSVLLLEAGPDMRAHPPADLHDGWRLPQEFDWGYTADPDSRGVAEDLRRIKLVGGSSWLTRFAVRGSPADYGEWAAAGNPGWGFDDVLPFLKRLESDAEFGDQPWHGNAGPIPVTRYPSVALTDVCAAGLEALTACGFASVDDLNRPGAMGAGRMPMSSRDGERVSTADAYLPAEGTRQNLFIKADAHAAGIVFEGTRATGVRLTDGSVVEAGWVVLSAGTYGSPVILMRSGIGPADHLRSHAIPVLLDLPGVGENLIDHPGIDVDTGFRGQTRPTPILHVIATFRSSTADSDAPDLLLWMSDPRIPMGDAKIFEIDAVLLKPRSRGSVRLRSADPVAPPRVELPNLRDESDVERLAEGYARALDVASHPAIRRLHAAPPPSTPHGVDELRATVRKNFGSFPHVVGTCAMGPRAEDGAVVDASGAVHGTEHLSVVDASIVPTAHGAFTHVLAIMAAERLSDQIAALA
jgi:choline dehydrogenase-like flavoprotein